MMEYDKHICPICKMAQTIILDTYLCSKCDWFQIYMMVYDYKEYKRRNEALSTKKKKR